MKTILDLKRTFIVSFLLFIFMICTTDMEAQSSYSVNTVTKRGKSTITVKNSKTDFKVEYEGEISISDDDSDITDISTGGYIEIKKSSFGKRRRIVIENDGGELVKKFYIGRTEKPFYPDGKKWLGDILPDIIRTTTIGAKSRVDRFYANGGTSAVLNEIKQLESDFVSSAYIKLLLEKSLSSNDIVDVLDVTASVVESDHYISGILKHNQTLFLKDSKTINAYIEAAGSIDSDHYLSQVLRSVINNKKISSNHMTSLLEITDNIGSDHYITEVLQSVMNERELNSENMQQVMMLSKKIGSDHYKAIVLRKGLKNRKLSSSAYDALLNSANEIGSDHYISEVVKDLIDSEMDSNTFMKVVDLIENEVSSDHYAALLYKRMASKLDLTEGQLIKILDATSEVSSDHYLTEILSSLAPSVKRSSSAAKDAYIKAAKAINSDTYLGKAMKAIY